MLWEVEIRPAANEIDREGLRIVQEARALGVTSIRHVQSARSFLLQGDSLTESNARRAAATLLADPIVEAFRVFRVSKIEQPEYDDSPASNVVQSSTTVQKPLLNVLFKPGVTDNVASSTQKALVDIGFSVDAVATVRKYWFEADASQRELDRLAKRVLANDAVERVISGPLQMDKIGAGSEYKYALRTVSLRDMNDAALIHLRAGG